MKITALVSAAVLASTSPFVDASSLYNCKVQGTYQVFDDPNDPLLPTTSEKNWATTKIRSSYNAVHSVHNNDFTMTSSSFDEFDYEQARFEDGKEVILVQEEASAALRGTPKEKEAPLGWFIMWFFRLRALNVVSCRLCQNWDDDDAMRMTVDLDTPSTHSRWEAAWCDELQQGGKLVFEYATNCAFELYDCVVTSANPNEEDGAAPGDAAPLEIMDIVNAGPLVVGAGMEEIQAEAEAEIEAQEMHEG